MSKLPALHFTTTHGARVPVKIISGPDIVGATPVYTCRALRSVGPYKAGDIIETTALWLTPARGNHNLGAYLKRDKVAGSELL